MASDQMASETLTNNPQSATPQGLLVRNPQSIQFVCPICKGELEQQPDAYFCARDDKTYRITLGIPDFRVFPDPYIGFDAEDDKTARIVEEYPRRTFKELVEFYYSITPEVPPDLAKKYMRHVFSGVVRAESALEEIQQQSHSSAQETFLEIGCGTGGFLVAAAQVFDQVIGLDIALRWLIIAKKRLEEEGRGVKLIAACAEYLPFRDNSFQLVVGSDVIEHTKGQVELLRESYRVLDRDGALFLATPNRWSLTPEPHVKVWGVGFLPKKLRAPYVRWVRKIPYENISTLNYFDVRRLIARTNFGRWQILLPEFHPAHTAHLSRWERAIVPLYHLVKSLPLIKGFLYIFGPLFHIICFKTQSPVDRS